MPWMDPLHPARRGNPLPSNKSPICWGTGVRAKAFRRLVCGLRWGERWLSGRTSSRSGGRSAAWQERKGTKVPPDSVLHSPYGNVQLGDFTEVLSIPGRYLNDHCLIRHEGIWYFFGIVGSVEDRREVSIAHATSPDLLRWEVLPDALHMTGAWPENSSVFAPSVVEHEGRFFMLYAAADEWTTQRICLAVSDDLVTWERDPGNPVIVPSRSWSRWPGYGLPIPDELGVPNLDEGPGRRAFAERFGGTYGGCRDPHILRIDDGRFVAYWVSRMQEQFGHNLVCVAASVSNDLRKWQEVGPVFRLEAWPFDEEPSLEIESPCVVRKDGRYWLFFKHGWWTHFVASDSPLDFQGSESERLGFVHAAEVFHWEEEWWITHCSGDPRDFRYRESNRTRGLFVGKLDWPAGGLPRLIAP